MSVQAVIDGTARWSVDHADCRAWLPTVPSASVDAIISDPPYAEIDRPYGRLTEAEWHDLMRFVVAESRRILKPRGSAVFILQPNSERVGRMRSWLWEFMAWTAREWNQVQDAWWWNPSALPTGHGIRREIGLLRPSLKACVWLGGDDCHRDQSAVLLALRDAWAQRERENRTVTRSSRAHVNDEKMRLVAVERGGTTPFNVLPMSGISVSDCPSDYGHGAGTPLPLARWWTRYICPPGGIACDPFMGVGTMARAALLEGRRAIGCEQMAEYHATAVRILETDGRLAQEVLPFASPPEPVRAPEQRSLNLGDAA